MLAAEEASEPEGSSSQRLPSAAEVSKALGDYEREESERQQWLQGAEAAEQRRQSRLAFAGLSPAGSAELLRSVFAAQLATLNGDPSRYLSDARLLRPLGGGKGAAVERDGDSSLLESTVPVRTEDEDGKLAKVDLSLRPRPGGGYETANAISDLQLPGSAAGSITIGTQGLAISQAGATASQAHRFGEMNLLYPSVAADTDLLVSPTSFGVELFSLLRSEQSPERLRFAVDLPQGAELRSDGRGGAEVVRDGERLARIPTPWAVDAQQSDVPVELAVEGSSIVLDVPHRDGDYARPILVDPIVEDWVNAGENWYGGDNWDALSNGAWKWTTNNSNILHDICCWEGSHAGLLTIVKAAFYGPEQYGQWSYSTPNEKVYINYAWLIPFNRRDNGCGSTQPHDYAGLWNPGDNWIPHVVDKAKDEGNVSFSGFGKALIVGLGSGPPGVWLACDRVLYLGGVGIWLDDDYPPVVHSVEGLPSGWFSDETQLSITLNSGDEGLGVRKATITTDAGGVLEDPVGCDGLYGSRCPNERSSQFSASGDSFREGIRTSGANAEDPTGKAAGIPFETMVDKSPPEVDLGGQLAVMTNEDEGDAADPEKWEELPLPVYNLSIAATDGSLESDLTKRSGVKSIEVYLDDQEQPEEAWYQECPESSCPMTRNFPLKLSEIDTAGKHTLKVVVTDHVNKARIRKIEFEYFPATGIKDDYVMHHFPLPDGQGDEEVEEHPARPELAVNVMNGNLVYRQRDIDVEGPAVDLEVERYYNSQLPASQDSEWGEGWTLAQTPELKRESWFASQADLTDPSAVLEANVALPGEVGEEEFDPELQATLTRRDDGGYELRDETGESATTTAFDFFGKAQAQLTEGEARIDYSYESGALAEIAVKDPGSAGNPTEAPEDEEAPPPEAGGAPTYASTFGSYGTEDGQLRTPGDLAVDAAANIWVVDKQNNRIQRFDPEGNFLSKFGSYGTADGQLNRPASIAIDAAGDLWVTDANNHRVQKFSPQGQFLAKFGSYGTADGQFSGPEGIAIDEQGNLWISDTYNGRLQKFSPGGEHLATISSKGSEPGQIGEPTGIDIDGDGNAWVADWQNNRVSIFSPEGVFLSQFGSYGSGDGQFNRPDALDIDEQGNVWVGDQNNDRIQRFDLTGAYVDQFGTPGTGEGQFNFTWPMGLTADDHGSVWVADNQNHRIQRWALPDAKQLFTAHAASFGSLGAGEGQLSSPADLAIDDAGGIWVADRGNDRIQHFDAEGRFLSQFGSSGEGDGQLSAPGGIDLDPEGNVWVADTGNDRVQKFSPDGELLLKFGTTGTGNGQFREPVGIVYAPELPVGKIYVADRGNHRVQLFGKEGGFVGMAGSYGSGEKQLIEPSSIALGGPYGESPATLLIADSGNHRIQRWTWNGQFVNVLGSFGTEPGQLNRPEAVAVDEQGTVWVGDRANDRVQAFEEGGRHLGQFGSQGAGAGEMQLLYPMGIATAEGEVRVTDPGNHRIGRWHGFMHTPGPEAPLAEDDPKLQVQTPEGLVSSVSGEEAGTHSYSHEADLLTSHSGPQGETAYEYDEAERLSKVTLPNGTWGQIAYYADNRVKSVTVSVEGGEAKTTHITYKDDAPRRTTVNPPDAPHVVYEIGADGSVLKWWNTAEPPELSLTGTLYDAREEDDALSTGAHWLKADAYDAEGIASIEIVVNGDTLVQEVTCYEDPETSEIECVKPPITTEWVAETAQHAPGHLVVEAIATDHKGEASSERFWVDIPEPPPPPAPGTPIPPTFSEIRDFRKEYGLEVVFPVANETELNERIFNLIKAWYEPHTPAGEVARTSWERWGIPLRSADVAELEYREWLYDINAEKIDQWVEATSPSSYAGYYLDHLAGGVMHIGFLGDQAEQLATLETSLSLVGGSSRLSVYPNPPTVPYVDVRVTTESVLEAIEQNSTLADLVVSVEDDEAGRATRVGTPDIAQVESILDEMLGPDAPVAVEYEAGGGALLEGRYRNEGRMRAGDYINSDPYSYEGLLTGGPCTAGFGAEDRRRRSNGGEIVRLFLLTAGHCAVKTGEEVWRNKYDGDHVFEFADAGKSEVGRIRRSALQYLEPGRVRTDGAAIRIKQGGIVPRKRWGWDGHALPTKPARKARKRNTVCYSGAVSKNVSCGKIVARSLNWHLPDTSTYLAGYWVRFPKDRRPVKGDSGSPVWNLRTGASIGLVSAGRPKGSFEETLVAPLLHPPNMPANRVPGILHHHAMAPLRLKLGG